MTAKNHGMVPDLESDPFGERSATLVRKRFHLLGARFDFKSNRPDRIRLVDPAYARLPRHRLSARAPDLRISLRLTAPRNANGAANARLLRACAEPPPLAMLHGAGLLGCASDSSNFVVLSPRDQ